MPVRIATEADAPQIAALWNQAASIVAATYPDPVAENLTAKQVADQIAHPDQTIYVEPDGWFLTRPERVPWGKHRGQIGSRLVLWITTVGLPDAEYRRVLAGLFAAWFADHRGELCWGSIPETQERRSVAYLEAQAFERHDYVDQNGVAWRLYSYIVPRHGQMVVP